MVCLSICLSMFMYSKNKQIFLNFYVSSVLQKYDVVDLGVDPDDFLKDESLKVPFSMYFQ